MTTIRKPEWFFIPAWIIVTVLSVPLAFILYLPLIRLIMLFTGDFITVNGVRHITEDYLFGYLFVPLVGLLTGCLQYGLLRRYLPRMGGWVLATTAGWVVALVLIMIGSKMFAFLSLAELLGGFSPSMAVIVIGLCTGIGQWLLLRKRLPRSGGWVGATIAGWTFLSLIMGNGPLDQFGLLVIGIFPACVTAVTFMLLMIQDRSAELPETKTT